MRKFVGASVVLITVTAIALLVRPQLGEEVAAPEGNAPTVSAPDNVPAGSGLGDTAAAVVTPVSKPAATSPEPRPARPVVSGQIDPVEAPEPTASDEDVQDGAAILKRASAAYSKMKSMRAEFVQRRENPLLNSSLTSRGTMYQKSPDRFALKFSQPAGDVIVADGRYFWVYYPSVDRRQVIRATASESGAGAVDLQSQFIGDPVQRFKYTYEGTQKMGARTVHVLTLVPRTNAGYKSMKVWIDSGDALVRRFQIIEATGAVVEFQLSNVTVNPELANEIFRFTPPAGAQVIER